MCISSPTGRVMEANESGNETTEEAVWQRVVQARVHECVTFGDTLFLPIFEYFGENVSDRMLFAQTLEGLLHRHIRIFTGRDSTVTVTSRRQSWRLVQGAFTKIEDAKREGVDVLLRSQDISTGGQLASGLEVPNEATRPYEPTSTPSLESVIPVRSVTRGPENKTLSHLHDEMTPISYSAQVVGPTVNAISAVSPSKPTPTISTEATANVATRQEEFSLVSNQLANENAKDAGGIMLSFSPVETSKQRKRKNPQESSDSPTQGTTPQCLQPPASDDSLSRPTIDFMGTVQINATHINPAPISSSGNEIHSHKQLEKGGEKKQANWYPTDLEAEPSKLSQFHTNGELGSMSEWDTRKKIRLQKDSLPKVSVDSNYGDLYEEFDSSSNLTRKTTSDEQRGMSIPPGLSSKYTRMNDRENGTRRKDESRDRVRRSHIARSYDEIQADASSEMSASDDSTALKTLERKSLTHRRGRKDAREHSTTPGTQSPNQFSTCSNLDVLITWRNRANNWDGNIDFVRRMNRYCSSKSLGLNDWMDDLILKAIQDVERKGGRILREYSSFSSAPLCDDEWVLLDRPEALNGLRKILKDNTEFAWSPSEEQQQRRSAKSRHDNSEFAWSPSEEQQQRRSAKSRHDNSEFAWSPSEERQQRRSAKSRHDTGNRNIPPDDRTSFSPRRRETEDRRRSFQAPCSESVSLTYSKKFIVKHRSCRKWWCRLCLISFHYDEYEDHLLDRGHQKRIDDRRGETRANSVTDSSRDVRHQYMDHQVATRRGPSVSSKDNDTRPTNGASKRVTFPVLQDIGEKTFARTLKKRERTNVTVDIRLHHDFSDVQRRLSEWDPFWINLQVVHVGVTSKVQGMDPHSDVIKTATQYYLPYPLSEKVDVPGLDWSQTRRSVDDVVLLLRMLPMSPDAYHDKRADCHLWPKGTFVQINGKPVEIYQRTQQAHHEGRDWKGMSKELDVTPLVELGERNRIQLCCFDEPFIYTLVCCKFRSVSTLFQTVTDQTSPERLTLLSRDASIEKAILFASRQMVISQDDDDDAEVEQQPKIELGKFVFSLSCPYSKNIILSYPVRGKNCKHFQCFDLKSYLSCNAHVTGSRWRCASCENFVSLQSLEICGFTSDILKEFNKVLSPTRDRVQVCADGTYMLLEERKERSRNRSTNDAVDPPVVAID